jgi:exonuclease SbcC
MENWKANPVVFVERIDTFARNWKENTEKLEQYSRQKAALEATLKELENQSKSLASEVSKKTEAHLAQHNIHLDLARQRNALFGGQAAEGAETKLKQAQSQAQQQLEQLKENQQQLNIDSTKAHTQKEELAATLATLEAETQKIAQKMQDWLNDYNQKNNQSLNIEAAVSATATDRWYFCGY